MINVEFKVYELLGASPAMLHCYKLIHNLWRWYDNTSSGYAKDMRLTG